METAKPIDKRPTPANAIAITSVVIAIVSGLASGSLGHSHAKSAYEAATMIGGWFMLLAPPTRWMSRNGAVIVNPIREFFGSVMSKICRCATRPSTKRAS